MVTFTASLKNSGKCIRLDGELAAFEVVDCRFESCPLSQQENKDLLVEDTVKYLHIPKRCLLCLKERERKTKPACWHAKIVELSNAGMLIADSKMLSDMDVGQKAEPSNKQLKLKFETVEKD